ncbi:glycosyltransferase family 2 protein [Lutibacter sp. B1]|uniref:glycosyltransferase family 2 protein n=1 Tax=Lutibacter sp. B1 TaxID=2725996 RepID=UPI0014576725|nr:glycosyltransferase family 2 protein [Lutibacter sp. B1]NLP56603.1 glycosyltransferase [Lutibacter sp. B1]
MHISVIISTYNSPVWLEKVLWGYNNQTHNNFELVIADDGSKNCTKDLIDSFRTEANYPITHVWQEDNGFQKSQILNKAILQCKASYIIMSDGDCIPKSNFVEVHDSKKKEGYFLSGGYFKLSKQLSEQISKKDIFSKNCFDIKWLKKNGLKKSFKNNKLSSKKIESEILNKTTPTKATWNGHNASGWKKDIIAVNGFDERMQYGGQDRELGERLFNFGIKSKQLRYSAIVIHLDHPRGYANKESWKKNKEIRKYTRKNKIVNSPFGLIKHGSYT